MAPFFLLWFFLLLIFIMLAKVYSGNHSFYTRQVDGRIIYSDCVLVAEFDPEKHCTIEVQYTVGSSTYTKSFMVHPDDKYQNGQSITVYYSPSNPQRSVLKKKSGMSGVVYLALSLMWFSFGMFYFFYPSDTSSTESKDVTSL